MVRVSWCSRGETAVFPCLKDALLAQAQFFCPPGPIDLLLQSSFPADQPSRVYQSGILYLSLGTGFAISLFLYFIKFSFVQAVNIFLNGSTDIWGINQSLCKLLDGALCPIIQISNEGFKLYWPWYQSLELVTGLHLYFRPLITTLGAQQFKQSGHFQAISPYTYLACTLSLMRDSAAVLLKTELKISTTLPSSTKQFFLSQKAILLGKHDFCYVNPHWLLQIIFLSLALGKGFQKDMLHPGPREWGEVDWPIVPQILLLTLLGNCLPVQTPELMVPCGCICVVESNSPCPAEGWKRAMPAQPCMNT